MRVLIVSTTTGYQLRAFDDAAKRLGFELVFATDRCHQLDDPWRDRAVPVRFYDEAASLGAIERMARERPLNGVIAVGDRPAALAALTAERLALPGNPPAAVRVAASKLRTREALDRAGLPVPWYVSVPVDSRVPDVLARLGTLVTPRSDAAAGRSRAAAGRAPFPCVVKPLAMAASRGVMRADDPPGFREAFERVRSLLQRRDVRAQRNDAHASILIEAYIPGAEHAVEGIVERGELRPLALFDKPDPLEGPFFEETIYVTPSRLSRGAQEAILHTAAAACRAIGLRHGPVHAEVRVSPAGVYVLEVAARPIGGLCARALRFMRIVGRAEEAEGAEAPGVSLEELLLLHATGTPVQGYVRERRAAGVMMIPVPRRGQFKGIGGLEEARRVAGIEEIVITAKPDQMLVPLPEGASYPGFIFARAKSPDEAERALRQAHAALHWSIERPIEVVPES